MRRILLLLGLCFVLVAPLVAQQRPLRTADAETVPEGHARIQAGFDFLQDVSYPLSGLSGDQLSVGVFTLRMGVGRMIEVQVEGAVRHFLDVRGQVSGPITPVLTGTNSTRDFGDISVFTKLRLVNETSRRPAIAFRSGFQMPTSNQARGIGMNAMNIFSGIIVQKHFGRLNVFGNLGLAILQAPSVTFTQNDVLTYGLAFIYRVHPRANLVGEVAGWHSWRDTGGNLVGTESRGQGRLGWQFLVGGFQWDVGAIAGLNRHDPKTGFTFGVSRTVRLLDHSKNGP